MMFLEAKRDGIPIALLNPDSRAMMAADRSVTGDFIISYG
jgi:hypothetical protein